MTINRRRFLVAAAAGAPLAVLGLSSAGAQTAAACYDPESLPLSQKNRRRSLSYVEQSADPAKQCALCAFYTATAESCGKCTLLNSQVNAGAVCASFAPKPK
jgi:hypothetical protein